jgi:hypothetical protein
MLLGRMIMVQHDIEREFDIAMHNIAKHFVDVACASKSHLILPYLSARNACIWEKNTYQ